MKHFFSSTFFLLLLLLVLGACAVTFGAYPLTPSEWGSIQNGLWQWSFVGGLRFYRALGALAVGMSLACSGALFQGVLRNPLAEPYTLGISGGAGVGAALAFVLQLPRLWLYAVPACALTGALLVLGMVLWLSRGGRNGRESLLLSGVIASTIASSILIYLLSVAKSDELAGVTWWMLGDLQSAGGPFLFPMLGVTLVLILLIRMEGSALNALALGDETAWNWGFPVRWHLNLLIVAGALLAAQTVALCGMIGFVGLMIPHLARKFYGCDYRKNLIRTALLGGNFLLLCDLLSRVVDPAREIPIGVITALLGGPLFLWQLNRRKRQDNLHQEF